MPTGSFNLLVLCVANICRSPAFELMLLQGTDGRPGLARGEVQLGSAGWSARHGVPLAPPMAKALRNEGFQAPVIWSRPADAALVERADLVLVATRELRSAVVGQRTDWMPKTFTVREFARYCAALLDEDPTSLPHGQAKRLDRALRFAQMNRGGLVPRRPEDDDVQDPYGRSWWAYRRCVRTLHAAAVPLLSVAGAPEATSESW